MCTTPACDMCMMSAWEVPCTSGLHGQNQQGAEGPTWFCLFIGAVHVLSAGVRPETQQSAQGGAMTSRNARGSIAFEWWCLPHTRRMLKCIQTFERQAQSKLWTHAAHWWHRRGKLAGGGTKCPPQHQRWVTRTFTASTAASGQFLYDERHDRHRVSLLCPPWRHGSC